MIAKPIADFANRLVVSWDAGGLHGCRTEAEPKKGEADWVSSGSDTGVITTFDRTFYLWWREVFRASFALGSDVGSTIRCGFVEFALVAHPTVWVLRVSCLYRFR